MKEHRAHVAQVASTLGSTEQALFCLFAAERLRASCWAYQASGLGNLELGLHTLDQAFQWVSLDPAGSKQNVASVYGLLESQVPRQGSPLAVQAQAGMVALLAGLDLLAGLGQATVVDASNFLVDAVDNFHAFSLRRITGVNQNPPERSELLSRELNSQKRDLQFLLGWSRVDLNALSAYRLVNVGSSLPVAV